MSSPLFQFERRLGRRRAQSAPLIEERCFVDQDYNDIYYWEKAPYPEIWLILPDDPDRRAVEEIQVGFWDVYNERRSNVKFEPYELLLPSFWVRVQAKRKEPMDFPPYRFSHRLAGQQADSRWVERFKTERGWNSLYCFSDIWNSYCLFAGNTTISRDQFCAWLQRVHAVIYDLLELRDYDAPSWEMAKLEFDAITQNASRCADNALDQEAWRRTVESGCLNRETAMDLRKSDALTLLNTFPLEVKLLSPIERFLKTLYESVGNRLAEDRLLSRCDLCGMYFYYRPGKRYCSAVSENRDCGKRARNKKDYERRKAERRKKNRESTRELRAFYRSKGVKK